MLFLLPPLCLQSSGSCSYQEQQRILGLFELSQEFKQQHYLTGLLLTELSAALDMESEGYGNDAASLLYLSKLLPVVNRISGDIWIEIIFIAVGDVT